ncbi:MAG: Fe-S-containing hydro-lyase [Epulopiscium sp.]|nr:Fe-S-containing hydro-lyase [Candidatus Epulonipiscium sp.]
MPVYLETPLTKEKLKTLQVGDQVLLSGTIYTARDAAHKRLVTQIKNKETLPISLTNEIIYYMGPSPARPNQVIGSAGPTTSYRMDAYTPLLLEQGLLGMIGKGKRSEAVRMSIQKHQSIYFAAIGGAGALLSHRIKSAEMIAYKDLATEAIRKLVVEDFPIIVAIDIKGNDIYRDSKKKYRKLELFSKK